MLSHRHVIYDQHIKHLTVTAIFHNPSMVKHLQKTSVFFFQMKMYIVISMTTFYLFPDIMLHRFLLILPDLFSNSYFLEKNSLILSATIDGKRIETVEVSLKTLEVVQSRGLHNSNTEYHDRIVNLVNSNVNLIRQRMEAA